MTPSVESGSVPTPISAAQASLASVLSAIVGEAHIVYVDLKRSYEHDLTGRFSGKSLLVVRPADTGEVAAVLKACNDAEVCVVPQGGHTGLVGGGTPRDDEVVLSLARLQTIETLDRVASQVTVGAGVTLESLQQRARSEGLDFPIDHGARSSATIGGMVATNAGGHLAVRYGTMRSQVLGLEAVLPDGRIITRLSGLVKDNAGFDLPGLLVGSEGVLAVITLCETLSSFRFGEGDRRRCSGSQGWSRHCAFSTACERRRRPSRQSITSRHQASVTFAAVWGSPSRSPRSTRST